MNDPDEFILKHLYYVKCPVFGEDEKIKPGRYKYALWLLPNRDNLELGAAQEQTALQFLEGRNRFCNSSSGGRLKLDFDDPQVRQLIDRLKSEHPSLADANNEMVMYSFQMDDYNPPLFRVWDVKADQAQRFEQLGHAGKAAAIITPSSEQMHAYLDELKKEYQEKREEWVELFGDVSSVSPDEIDAKMSGEQQYTNQFLLDDGDKVWMRPAWMIANELAESGPMYEAVKALSENRDCQFSYSTNQRNHH